MKAFSEKEVLKENRGTGQRFSSLYKPGPDGQLGFKTNHKDVESRILNELKWFGWKEDFGKNIVEIKRRLFKENDCFSGPVGGQLEAINLRKKINGITVSLTINRFFAYFSVISISGARKHRSVNEICDVIRELLPEMQLTITEKKLEDMDGFSVCAEGNIQREKKEKRDLRYHGFGC